MSDIRKRTIDTYNRSAKELAVYFQGIGARVRDIEQALDLAGRPQDARVVEIGCGDGRDAKEIVKRVGWYRGFDISEELIKLADESLAGGYFEVADATEYDFPDKLDIVFAFASLLHLDKNEVRTVLGRVHESLKPGGIFFISLKERPEYSQEIKDDQYGSRLFYFYNPRIIAEIAGKGYETVAISQHVIGHTDWFEIALKKV